MQYILTDYSRKIEYFAYWNDAFSEEELNYIQTKAKQAQIEARVGNGSDGAKIDEVRRSMVNWLECNNETRWIYERLSHVVSSLNAQFFNFDLRGFGEAIQLTNYDETYEGMYNWHVDFGMNVNSPSRKLSLVLQLSDPVDYEGGVLEIRPHGAEVIKIKKQRGMIVCFPSWTLHQVTPVTKGNRQSLVSWITGPSFV